MKKILFKNRIRIYPRNRDNKYLYTVTYKVYETYGEHRELLTYDSLRIYDIEDYINLVRSWKLEDV